MEVKTSTEGRAKESPQRPAASDGPARRTVRILGSEIDILDIDDAVSLIQGWIDARDGQCRHVVASGFHAIWHAHRDPQFKQVVNSAALWFPDGIAPVWIARLRGIREARRVPGPEVVEALLAKADMAGYRSFFFGETEETLARLVPCLEERYPGHRVAGTLSPPFRPPTPEEDEEHVRIINRAKPDILWVALGAPKQERWIYEHRQRLDVPVAIGIGVILRFLTGQVPRAPAWVGRAGFEWAFRLLMEPKKCWHRCFVQGPQFLAHVAMELGGIRKYD